MRKLALCPALLMLFCLSPLRAGEFRLEEISHIFESKGFEDQIDFWVKIFARYGERDVVFHDRRDLRIIYDVLTVDRAPKDDPEEAKRQKRIFEDRADEIEEALSDLKAGEDLAERPEARRVAAILTGLGYEIDPELCSKLQENIRFQRGIKEKFRDGVIRSGLYLGQIEDVFREHGLPLELALLPHVESSFEYGVRSKAGAAGIWQFTRGTGRLFLRINNAVDERLDPIRSTRAAARLLKENYDVLGSWPLAVVAYNHGRGGMLRAKQRHGEDLLKIVREYDGRSFGFASRNFYPEFLAAVLVASNSEAYFGPLQPLPPLSYDTVSLRQVTPVQRLVSSSGTSLAELKQYNPHLLSRTWSRSLPAGLQLRVPPGLGAKMTELISGGVQRAEAGSPALPSTGSGEAAYKVQRGDTLLSIARRFGVSVSAIESANGLRDRHLIHPGQTLRIPSASSVDRPLRYRVRKGDTLHSIAQKFQVTLAALRQTNRLRDPHLILLGQILLIPSSD